MEPNNLQHNPAQAKSQHTMYGGRLNRVGYLMTHVYFLAYCIVLLLFITIFRSQTIAAILGIALIILGIIFMIPISVSAGIRRWHDMNQSGWCFLFGFIPFVGIGLTFIYLFSSGTKEINKYGEPDSSPSTIKKVFFGR